MRRLTWRSILQRVEARRIVGHYYCPDDGDLRIELDDGSVRLLAALGAVQRLPRPLPWGLASARRRQWICLANPVNRPNGETESAQRTSA
ncbi:MAG: hypothetical protein V3T08_01285, partial [Gemmatimonadota bacterium]